MTAAAAGILHVVLPLALVLAVSAFAPESNAQEAGTAPSAQAATIPDASLRAALEKALGKATGETITVAELQAMSGDLDLRELGIADLSGLELVAGITAIHLGANAITDLSPLGGLSNLTVLNLRENAIADLTPLASLSNLNRLYLRENSVSDLSPLASLTNLTILHVDDNGVDDISALSGLTNLRELDLGENAIGDISILSGLSHLTTLRLDRNSITDVSALSGLSNLTKLYLDENSVSDVSAINGLSGLAELGLSRNSISDVSPLASMSGLTLLGLWDNAIVDASALSNLEILYLDGNEISDFSPLAGLTKLTRLGLSRTAMTEIEVLAELTDLTRLYLWGNEIQDVSTLSRLSRLETLSLSRNAIADISPLSGLSGLTTLSLHENLIEDVSGLAGLSSVTELGLNWNHISDISALADLTSLTELRLAGNEVEDIAALENLIALSLLDLSGNPIDDPSPLLTNAGLGEGDTLYSLSNRLTWNSVYESLRGRGVRVDSRLTITDTGSDEYLDSHLSQLHNENVLVMNLSEDLTTSFNSLPTVFLARDLYRSFDDVFDFLVFLSNLDEYSDNTERVPYGRYRSIMNDTEGTGRDLLFRRHYGSSGKLRGVVQFPYNQGLRRGPALHEFQHAWANYTVPTASPSHWGFSSANGQLGGFDGADLVDLGGGQYSAGSFGTIANGGNSVPYSPIELYFGGFVAAEQVPDLWVATDGRWVVVDRRRVETEAGHPLFSASEVRDVTVEEIIAEFGTRVPGQEASQKEFRAAVILLTDADHPATPSQLEDLSQTVSAFSTNGDDGSSRYNFFEATGGRASMEMGELSQVRKSVAVLPFAPASFGEPPPDSFCWPEGSGDLRFGHREPHARAPRTRGSGVTLDVEGVAGSLHETTARGSRGGAASPTEPPAYPLGSYLAGAAR
ncbi:MAG: leucine-rich repeat domain-containing protein [Bryobacterales bacterium]|nr:leucine-rich repeat domain-containing protein [Bryobacterales bacterium]